VIRVTVWNTARIWRLHVLWRWFGLSLNWCSDWGQVDARGGMGWTREREFFRLG
jgi:hypothetical protein